MGISIATLALGKCMPTHSLRLSTRQLVQLMELTKGVIEDGDAPYGERLDASEMYHAANRELGYPEDGRRIRA
ncbi:hypothetical protein SAMN04488133_1949 [Halobellus limi]|uniref:Uncharacterized protein n=1 Tax=Halobellus limi TaxID=699433 RepID=A0A1H5ZEW9_9EURY|nr:hypothetical protein SAMN04488133_1949 [Halobellus limi]